MEQHLRTNERDELILAAKAVAIDESGTNLARLISAVMDLPLDQMPREYLDQPMPPRYRAENSIGDQLRFLTYTHDTL